MPLSDEMFEYDRFTKPFSVSALVIYYTKIFHLALKHASDQYVSPRIICVLLQYTYNNL